MSEAVAADLGQSTAAEREADGRSRLTELRVSANLMALETGLYCIMNTAAAAPADGSGLPGIRVSAAPGPSGRPDAVSITTFHPDGWLGGVDDAALVRVASGPAQVLVTVYQSPNHGAEAAPRLQVTRLSVEPPKGAVAKASAPMPASTAPPEDAELVAHVSRAGDILARLGDWVGVRGSQRWIEGFGIIPKERENLRPNDIEYQAVLGRGWLSPWVEGGTFCGSRGMSLPLLGLRVRLRGPAADAFECGCTATFVDGTEVGPVPGGEACEAESLSPLESFRIVLSPKTTVEPAMVKRPTKAPATPTPPRTARVLKSARQSR